MKQVQNPGKALVIAALAFASIPVLAQQTTAPAMQQTSPATQQTTSPSAQTTMQPQAAQSTPSTASAPMSQVNGELVDKLDTKTAKNGDSVVIKTKSNVTTADGTEIPKGSKLVGHVVQVKPSGQTNDNSQLALQFDQAQLKGGQNVPIHAVIQSLSTDDANAAGPNAMSSSPSAMPSASSGSPSGGMNGGMNNSGAATTNASPATSQAQMNAQPNPQSNGAASAAADPNNPAPGTVVARTGNIAIRTTAIPGVLLANNEPGQQDPRMAQASGILLGPKRDIHLDSGTKVVVGVASANTATAGGGN